MAEYDGEEYIIANLNKKHLNEQLDLAFSIGEKMAFKVGFVMGTKFQFPGNDFWQGKDLKLGDDLGQLGG